MFPFSREQVRVLLFRECDWTGRRLLFDSNAVQKVSIPSKNETSTQANTENENVLGASRQSNDVNISKTLIDICNGYGYIYNQASQDSNNIGEMVFGSVAMSFQGTSLKVC